MHLPPSSKFSHVLIFGAGATGLLQAAMMKACDLSFLVLERRSGRRASSRVGLLHGEALDILHRSGLLEFILPLCRPVDRVTVRTRTFESGEWSFRPYAEGLPAALAIQQSSLEAALLEHLEKVAPNCVFRSVALDAIQHAAGALKVQARFGVSPAELTGAFIVATDGPNTLARTSTGRTNGMQLPPAYFIAGDFVDGGELGDAIRLTKDPAGFVESLPVPGGRRRWIVQTSGLERQPDANLLVKAVWERAGIDLSAREAGLITGQRMDGWLADTLVKGRVVLSGESAYGIAPLCGGPLSQAVLDARDVAGAIQHVVQSKAAADAEFARYTAGCKARIETRLRNQSEMLGGGGGGSVFRSLARVVAGRLPGRNPAEQLYAS